MSLFDSFFDSFLFGRDKSALDVQRRQNKKTRDFAEKMWQQSRDDMMALYPGAQDNLNMGIQSALNLYGQSMPQQMGLYQQGNVGAQNTLINGMGQFQNAILGLPVDNSSFQPQQLSYDTSWMQQQLPDFRSVADLLGGGGANNATGGTGGYGGGYNPIDKFPRRVKK